MPRHKTNKTEKSTDFPVIFYQSIPADKIKNTTPSDLKKRQILKWSGVIIIMTFLIVLWGMTLKERISTANNKAADSGLNFLKNKRELSEIFRDNNQRIEKLKNLGGLIKQALANPPPAPSLSASQIEELKVKIEKMKD